MGTTTSIKSDRHSWNPKNKTLFELYTTRIDDESEFMGALKQIRRKGLSHPTLGGIKGRYRDRDCGIVTWSEADAIAPVPVRLLKQQVKTSSTRLNAFFVLQDHVAESEDGRIFGNTILHPAFVELRVRLQVQFFKFNVGHGFTTTWGGPSLNQNHPQFCVVTFRGHEIIDWEEPTISMLDKVVEVLQVLILRTWIVL